MGLQINKPISAMGLDLNQVYCRLHLRYYFTGDKVDVWVQTYVSKQAFEENISNSFVVPGISRQYQFDYDRERDGSDILLFCHEKIKGLLTTDVTEEREVIKEKFCEPEEIVIQLNSITKDPK